MKKVISTLLAILIIVFSLIGCSNNNGEKSESNSSKNEYLSVGDTISTDTADVVITDVQYGAYLVAEKDENYDYIITNSEDYLLAVENDEKTDFDSYKSQTGKKFVSITFKINNTGKNTIERYLPVGETKTSSILNAMFSLNYNDGYTFYPGTITNIKNIDSVDDYFCTVGENGYSVTFDKLEVLAEAKTYRTVIQVPAEVADGNEELLLNVNVPTIDSYQQFIYKLR